MNEKEKISVSSYGSKNDYLGALIYGRGFINGFNMNKVSEDLGGIYILYSSDEILYIGESTRVRERLKYHINRLKDHITSIDVIPFAKETTKQERVLIEKMFINFLQPKLNERNTKKDFFEPKFTLEFTENVDYYNSYRYTLDELKRR
ncbi:GIY-YIG nuclease family protein [Priestia megaterium]|uniref:GIY-YIG nuclease family protein n=1 Tax=Priestia megaterium TaxID=1404 RepID=UPI0020792C28|nr:GIY-YIG nuclease family protein [Priestia megaterium]USL25101.1 GIY-YIG nuclease family protein [Priestia megaterium]